MITVADIQKDLPHWPEDVVEQWLLYFANEPDCGWPPPEPLGAHRWNVLLFGKPVTWWKNVTWKKQLVNCTLSELSAKTRGDVADIVRQWNDGTASASTQRRVAQPWLHIRDNGVFPRSPLMIKQPDGWSLADGHHRMAAFEMFQGLSDAELSKIGKNRPSRDQDVWVGTHTA
ncbi:MAG TPA: hypothetical protein VGU01_06825 [Sphingomicrobium sp.]|nr:hypothetical protein [Sphingomicrobium sp.]